MRSKNRGRYFSPKDACSLTRLTSCVFEFFLEAADVIILIAGIHMSFSHLRDNEAGSPVTPESALDNVGRKMIAKVNNFMARNIQKFLDSFLKKMFQNVFLKYSLPIP